MTAQVNERTIPGDIAVLKRLLHEAAVYPLVEMWPRRLDALDNAIAALEALQRLAAGIRAGMDEGHGRGTWTRERKALVVSDSRDRDMPQSGDYRRKLWESISNGSARGTQPIACYTCGRHYRVTRIALPFLANDPRPVDWLPLALLCGHAWGQWVPLYETVTVEEAD